MDRRILAADEDDAIRAAIVRVLAEQPDAIVEPRTAEEALEVLRSMVAERGRLLRENRSLLDHLQRGRDEFDRVSAQLQDMANRDSLTGLYNHRYFRTALEQEQSRSRRHKRSFALLLADVDHFAHYNDQHGQLAGDDLLRWLAKLLQERCRASTVVARFGGNRFALLIPEAQGPGAITFAETLRRMVEQAQLSGADEQPGGRVTISIGVATYPQSGEDCAGLIESAAKALARAKDDGRNAVMPAPRN
jgi:diguanylate cyclase (GGDEF)-like protein